MPQEARSKPQALSGLCEVNILPRYGWSDGDADQKTRAEFEKNIKIDKRDFGAIEFLLRKGRRQLDMYSSPGVKDIK
jgi:hypothetical protein